MELKRLDHINIKTGNLDGMVEWYCTVLGMEVGDRPPFGFPGAWLYAADYPVVHFVGVDGEPQGLDPKIEHFALSAEGLESFLVRLKTMDVRSDLRRVPGLETLQVNLFDPDGNHIHIDFSPEEADALGL